MGRDKTFRQYLRSVVQIYRSLSQQKHVFKQLNCRYIGLCIQILYLCVNRRQETPKEGKGGGFP